jgi:hypothetical protein
MLNCQIKNLLKGPKATLKENHKLLLYMAQNGPAQAQEAGERRATKVQSPGWMRIDGGIGQKGLKPHRSGVARSEEMDLRCPKCNSNNLKKVSLAYQEGTYHINTRGRMRGLLFDGGGPGILVGRTTTGGSQQSALAKRLNPPSKWSYVKLVLWSGVVTFIALILYVQQVMSSSVPASSFPVRLYLIFAPVVLLLLVGIVWRHNGSTYEQKYAQWNESFICGRCGTVSKQAVS